MPLTNILFGHAIQVDPAHAVTELPRNVGPVIDTRGLQVDRARAIHGEMDVPRGGTVGNNGNRFVSGVRGVFLDFHIEHCSQPAHALSTNAEGIDGTHQLQPQFFPPVGRAPGLEGLDIDGIKQRLLGHQHGFFRGTANSHAKHSGRTPASTHTGNLADNPVDNRIGRIQHGKFCLRLRTATLGRQINIQLVPRHQFVVDYRRRIVTGIFTCPIRVLENRRAQDVIRQQISPAHALIDHLGNRQIALPLYPHTHFQKNGNDTGILTNRPMP